MQLGVMSALAAGLALGCRVDVPGSRQTVEVTLPTGGVFIGAADAPVLLVEFGSHSCPQCWTFAEHAFPLIEREFIRTGRVRYRFVGITASPLSAIVECAARVMGFQASRLAIYSQLRDSQFAMPPVVISEIGKNQGCVGDTAGAGRRLAEIEAARRARVPGTPTFLIGRPHPDGRVVGWVEVGYANADSLASVVQAALNMITGQ